jgi:hypothetical protein
MADDIPRRLFIESKAQRKDWTAVGEITLSAAIGAVSIDSHLDGDHIDIQTSTSQHCSSASAKTLERFPNSLRNEKSDLDYRVDQRISNRQWFRYQKNMNSPFSNSFELTACFTDVAIRLSQSFPKLLCFKQKNNERTFASQKSRN